MPYPCTDDPNEILEYVAAAKSNAQKFSTFVNGSSIQTVQLGEGDPTPTLRKFIADAQSVVATAANEAAETVLDDVADMKLNKADKSVPAEAGNLARLNAEGNLRDSGRAAEDFVLLLAYAHDEALDLALLNRMNIEVYKEWYARGIAHLESANVDAMKTVQGIRDLIDSYDGSTARHRLQIRLFDGTTPGASSKPVLFVISGQSNAVGSGAYKPFDSARDCGQFWSWADGADELKPIVDPIARTDGRASGWSSFARRFFALTGRKVILLNIASGGSVVTDAGSTTTNTWADNAYGNLRSTRTAIWNAFNAAVPASSYDLGAILWCQGENDANRLYYGSISVADYIGSWADLSEGTKGVLQWTRNLIGASGCPVFLAMIGHNGECRTSDEWMTAYEKIHKAQISMFDYENIFPGFCMTPYFIDAWNSYMSDGYHYSRLGYKIQGESLARSVVNYLNF